MFASDNLSSSAYATEEILHILVPAIGLAAFSLVMPITLALLVVLAFLILSYRETIKAYPGAGGAYLVTRDNFGHRPAQIAGAALLTDYVLTVAVSMSAGTAALVSAFDALTPYRIPISLLFVALVAFGNLRGVRESGRIFAAPTYFFVVNMGVLLTTGMVRYFTGDLPVVGERLDGMIDFGDEGAGLLLGASAFIVLKAYASGGAAVTGVEAISNGVPAFRRPEWRNARQTLVIMGCTLGAMFLGLSFLASQIEHNVPEAIAAPLLRRHVVLVFIDRLDLAAVRAIQYARTLFPDELRAVHFVIDQQVADEIADAWTHYGLTRIALDLTDCPDRRIPSAAVEVVARDLDDGETEVTVLLPDRKYSGFWHRILHDQTADAIEREISRFPHANVTTVPFHFTSRKAAKHARKVVEPMAAAALTNHGDGTAQPSPRRVATPATADGRTPIGTVQWRQQVSIEGRIRTMRVQPLAGASCLECIIEDDTGTMSIVFLGRSKIAGIDVGTRLRAQGIAGEHHGRLAILNPTCQLIANTH